MNNTEPPPSQPLSWWKKFFSRKKKTNSLEESVSELIKEHADNQLLHIEEKKLLRNFTKFGNKDAHDIMISRSHIAAVSATDSLHAVQDFFLQCGHTRLPVYNNNIDEIIGIYHIKDMFRIITSNNNEEINLAKIVRPILHVPSSMKLTDLFAKMKQGAIHMVVVLDQYGCTDGIITIEDVLEELVGEIHDEYDHGQNTPQIKQEGNAYFIDAHATIEQVEEFLGPFSHVEDKYDTLGGYVIYKANRIPVINEELIFDGLHIVVLEATNRKINKLLVNRL